MKLQIHAKFRKKKKKRNRRAHARAALRAALQPVYAVDALQSWEGKFEGATDRDRGL